MFHTLFSLCFRNESQFRAESQDESHVDVIGYLTKTSEVVVGEKCGQLCFFFVFVAEKVPKHVFLSVINMVITDKNFVWIQW